MADWPGSNLGQLCCAATTIYPVKLLINEYGDRAFEELLAMTQQAEATVVNGG